MWLVEAQKALAASVSAAAKAEIVRLCRARKTAQQIAEALNLSEEQVRAVRWSEGIPSMTVGAGLSQQPNPEFEQWVAARNVWK